jgi:2-dehydro-3-deoxy-D-arabinonate dehydratase
LIAEPDQLRDVSIQLQFMRDGALAFQGETRTSQMKRKLEELVTYLGQELAFPQGVFLMTGTAIVPSEELTPDSGDEVQITVDEYTLVNQVLKSNGNIHTTG